jgi:hypothetical protein
MATLTVVFDDSVMIKDGVLRASFIEDADAASLEAKRVELGHSSVRAIQWNGTSGECEFNDGQENQPVTQAEVDAYLALFQPQYVKQTKTAFLEQDADLIAREKRDEMLAQTDWWAMADRTMTVEQTAYRQALRDLPSSADWNPTLTWDDDTWTGALTGVTWPTQP